MFKSLTSWMLLGLVAIIVAWLQYKFWLGEGGYVAHQSLLTQIEEQASENVKLKERNRILAAEVYDLKNGAEAIEEHARLDLGLVKPHETFVQMSTLSSQYRSIYYDPKADLRTNENPKDSQTSAP